MKNSTPSFDDLVFENRNKDYGAYILRQLTDRHSAYGLYISLGFFTSLIVLFLLLSKKDPQTISSPFTIEVTPIDIPEIIFEHPEPIVKTTPPPAMNTTEFIDPVNITNTVTETNMPTQEQLVEKAVSTQTVETLTSAADVAAVISTTAASTTMSSAETVFNATPQTWAPVMPSFPGGEAALKAYLSNNIKMHPIDIENGVSGKLWVRFYVDIDGSIKDAKVVKDNAGGRCGEMALPVIMKMPKWNPGMQNNKPVRVFYNLPISFQVKD